MKFNKTIFVLLNLSFIFSFPFLSSISARNYECDTLYNAINGCFHDPYRENCWDEIIKKYEILPDDCERCWKGIGFDSKKGEIVIPFSNYVNGLWKRINIILTYYSFGSGIADINVANDFCLLFTDSFYVQKKTLGRKTLSFYISGDDSILSVEIIPKNNSDIYKGCRRIYIPHTVEKIKLFTTLLSKKESFKSFRAIIFEDTSKSICNSKIREGISAQKRRIIDECDKRGIKYLTKGRKGAFAFGDERTDFRTGVINKICPHGMEESELPVDHSSEPYIDLVFILTDGIQSTNDFDNQSFNPGQEIYDSLMYSLWDMWEKTYNYRAQGDTQIKDVFRNPVMIMPMIVGGSDFNQYNKILNFWKRLSCYGNSFDVFTILNDPLLTFTTLYDGKIFDIALSLVNCQYSQQKQSMDLFLNLSVKQLENVLSPFLYYNCLKARLSPAGIDPELYRSIKTGENKVIFLDDLLLYRDGEPNLQLRFEHSNNPTEQVLLSSTEEQQYYKSQVFRPIDLVWQSNTDSINVEGTQLIIEGLDSMAEYENLSIKSDIGNGDDYKEITWTNQGNYRSGSIMRIKPNRKDLITSWRWLPISVSGVLQTTKDEKSFFTVFHREKLYFQPHRILIFLISLICFFISFSSIIALLYTSNSNRSGTPRTYLKFIETLKEFYIKVIEPIIKRFFRLIFRIISFSIEKEITTPGLLEKLRNGVLTSFIEVVVFVLLIHFVLPPELWKYFYICQLPLLVIAIFIIVFFSLVRHRTSLKKVSLACSHLPIFFYTGWTCILVFWPGSSQIPESILIMCVLLIITLIMELRLPSEQERQEGDSTNLQAESNPPMD